MAKVKVRNLFWFKPGYHIPCSLNIWQKIWWRFVPGEIINVKWPSGDIVVDHNDPRWQDMGGAVWVNLGFSSDPNDHYRPWLEKNVGRQGWDWNWGMAARDALDNQLTIKIRRKHAVYATMLALRWN
jgi:hypothetical protein